MSIQDPFFVVRDEVQQALMMARSLYSRWRDIEDTLSLVTPEEKEYTTNELRNSLRSIDWDLEDLEETVMEKNPKKFKINESELNERRNFIERSRAAVQDLRRQMNGPATNQVNGTHESDSSQGLLSSNGLGLPIRPDHYSRLDTPTESVNHEYLEDRLQQQQALIEPQESQEDRFGSGTGATRHLSHQNSNELEDQSALLDELGQEVEQPETRLSQALKRVASVVSLDRRQWCAIILLLVGIIILLVVFFTL